MSKSKKISQIVLFILGATTILPSFDQIGSNVNAQTPYYTSGSTNGGDGRPKNGYWKTENVAYTSYLNSNSGWSAGVTINGSWGSVSGSGYSNQSSGYSTTTNATKKTCVSGGCSCSAGDVIWG